MTPIGNRKKGEKQKGGIRLQGWVEETGDWEGASESKEDNLKKWCHTGNMKRTLLEGSGHHVY